VVIETVLFDLGGVILRTEHQAPREHLAERLGLSYEDLVQLVFDGPSARQASLGQITAQQHWENIASRLGRPREEIDEIRSEFFAGDVLDRELLAYIRSLRPLRRTGLLSNAWGDLREYIRKSKFDDAFDAMVISAEVGLLKPDPSIYELTLQRLASLPGQTVFVDDTAVNVEAARAIGIHSIQFENTPQVLAELQGILD
jgi:epoxide hydrolase-like predicted phosphatase